VEGCLWVSEGSGILMMEWFGGEWKLAWFCCDLFFL